MRPLDLLNLEGAYLDAYDAIVRPDRVWTVSRYFLRKWMRLLGPAHFWLVVALRQRCYWNEQQDWCIVNTETLAREAGISQSTLEHLLGQLADKGKRQRDRGRRRRPGHGLVFWFFQRRRRSGYNRKVGREVRSANLYTVALDDPLTPDDQRGLAALLGQGMAGTDDPVAGVEAVLEQVLALSTAEELDRALAEAAEGFDFNSQSGTATDVVRAVLGRRWPAGDTRLAELCSQVHRHITQPEAVYVGTQYFRLAWMPELGTSLASLVVALRSRCYWNAETGEVRDSRQMMWGQVAAELGLTDRGLRKMCRSKETLLSPLIEIQKAGRGRAPTFRVQMRDPLTPDDELRFKTTLRDKPCLSRDPETGQLDLMPSLQSSMSRQEPGLSEAEEKGPSGLDPEGEQNGVQSDSELETTGDDGERNFLQLETELFAVGSQGERNFLQLETELFAVENGTFCSAIKALISTYTTALAEKAQQQQHGAGAPNVAVVALLDFFEITGSNRRRILAHNPSPDTVLGWMLYAIANDFGTGYVVKQLLANDPPLPTFLEFARLPGETWATFLAAAVDDGQEIPPELADSFERWDAVFGVRLREELGQSRWEGELAGGRPRVASRIPDFPIPGLDVGSRELWGQVLDELRLQMTKATFGAWVRNTVLLSCDDGTFTIGAQNVYSLDWLENRLATTIERTLIGLVGRSVAVEFAVLDSTPVDKN